MDYMPHRQLRFGTASKEIILYPSSIPYPFLLRKVGGDSSKALCRHRRAASRQRYHRDADLYHTLDLEPKLHQSSTINLHTILVYTRPEINSEGVERKFLDDSNGEYPNTKTNRNSKDDGTEQNST